MVDFGKLLLGKDEEEEEKTESDEEEDEDIDSIISGAEGGAGAEMGEDDEGGIGAGGPQGSGGMGVAPDIRDDIDRNREDLRELEANVDTMGDTVEDIDERVKDIEEDISQLLDVYEMVTAEFNPFLDEEGALSGGGPPGSTEEEQEGWGSEGPGEEEDEGETFDEDGLDEIVKPPEEEEGEELEEMPDLEAPPDETTQKSEETTETGTEVVQPEQPQKPPEETEETGPQSPAEDVKAEEPGETVETQEYQDQEYTQETVEVEEKGDVLEKLVEELKPGKSYLLKTTDEDLIYESLSALVDGTSGLCITRKHPDDIKDKYDYEEKKIEFGWLSTSNEEIAIAPDELDILGLTVERFISDEDGVILLDGISYLLSNNPNSTLIHFIQSLQDQITVGNTIFLIAVDPSDIEEKNLELLKNELDVEVIDKKDLAPEPEKKESEPRRQEDRRRHEENLVAKVKRMMDFLDEQERALERKIDKVSRTSTVDVSDKVASPGVLDAIEGLEKEITMLSDELKRLKEKQMTEEPREVKKEETETPAEEEMEEFVEMVERGEELHEELEEIKEEMKTEDEVAVEEKGPEPEEEVEKQIVMPEEEVIEKIRETEEEQVKKDDGEKEPEPEKREDVIEPKKDEGAVHTEDDIELQAEVSGDIDSGSGVEIQKDVTVKGSLTAEGDIVLHDRATVEGDIISRGGNVKVGNNCTVNGKVSGDTVHISENSEVQVIEAQEDVYLGRSARASKVSSGGDVKLSEKVRIEDGIDYGGKLIFEGSEIAIGDLVNPFGEKKKKEVVKERWASR